MEAAFQSVASSKPNHPRVVSWNYLHRASLIVASRLTLGQVYDLGLKKNESLIKEVIIQAQGEMALEEYVKQVRETWTNYTLDLVNYQNKCRLIRGWDDLFTKCAENLNSLVAMKLSPYYKGKPRLFRRDRFFTDL